MSGDAKPSMQAGHGELARVVGVPGAVLMGLGSILGTGIFVSIGIAAGVTGPSVILAVVAAAAVATFNGLSRAQLAASHPVSGGTYEYGYRYLNPTLGFTAGWMFLCAKSASAATAALGFAGYVLVAAGCSTSTYRVALALVGVVVLTAIVAGGISRSKDWIYEPSGFGEAMVRGWNGLLPPEVIAAAPGCPTVASRGATR